MAIIHWEPFREIDQLQREMNRLFDGITRTTATNGERGVGVTFIPSAEIHETPGAIHLKLEIPGMEASDLNVEVTAEAVSISGERKQEAKTSEKGVTRTEFSYGQFRRVIPLSTRVQNDKVQAEYKNGVLSLTLPKAEEEKNKVVKVNIA